MWQCRTTEEIETIERRRRRARFNPLEPALTSLAIGLLGTLAVWRGYHGNILAWGHPIPFVEAMPCFNYGFVGGFIILYGLRLANSALFRPDLPDLICNCCHIEYPASAIPPDMQYCPCGGMLESIDHWRRLDEYKKAS